MKPIAYVFGPYAADNADKIADNVQRAKETGAKLAQLGYLPVVPHFMFKGIVEDADIMDCCLGLVQVAQVLVGVGEWQKSPGSMQEMSFARDNGIPVYSEVSCVPPASSIIPDTTTQAVNLLYERRRKGVKEYGRPLVPFNGRDSLWDAIEECADMLGYLLNALMERADLQSDCMIDTKVT